MSVTPGFIRVSSLCDEPLHFRSLTGREEMSRPFEYVVDVLSKRPDLKLGQALGQQMTITVQCSVEEGGERIFSGLIGRFSQEGMEGDHYLYRAVLHPWLWLLNRFSDCRIFQNKDVPTIVNDVLGKYQTIFGQLGIAAGFRDDRESADRYPPREYTVQYRESDLTFVSRLLEEAGIAYHFEHQSGAHTLVLTDSPRGRSSRPGYAAVPLRPAVGTGEIECLTAWRVSQELKSAACMLRDFDYMQPRDPVSARLSVTKDPSNEKGRGRQVLGELYDYPGGFLSHDRGDRVVATRVNEEQSFYEVVQAAGNTRGLGVGNVFALTEAPFSDGKAAHLVVGAHYELRGHAPRSGDDEPGKDSFHCSLTLLSSRQAFCPPRRTPRPVIQGPQTALVVGPRKDPDHEAELWTDDWGRVLLRFHWERLGAEKPDDPSRAHDEDANDDTARACWVRVASAWAGRQWGAQFTPRVGDEVMVEFLEGDPDRPIVTGRVYNNVNRPPYPNSKNTQSGIKTHSTPGGGADNFNELRFEDKRGSEELYVRAEKNHTVFVKADRTVTVGGNETTDVKVNHSTTVHGDDELTVDGTHHATVTKAATQTFNGGHRLEVNGGDQHITVAMNKIETVEQTFSLNTDARFVLTQGGKGGTGGKTTITAERDEITINGPAGLTLSSEREITLRVGGTSITLRHDQLEVKADAVAIVGQIQTDIAGGGASAKLHGAVDVSGTTVNLNG